MQPSHEHQCTLFKSTRIYFIIWTFIYPITFIIKLHIAYFFQCVFWLIMFVTENMYP